MSPFIVLVGKRTNDAVLQRFERATDEEIAVRRFNTFKILVKRTHESGPLLPLQLIVTVCSDLYDRAVPVTINLPSIGHIPSSAISRTWNNNKVRELFQSFEADAQ